MHLISVFLYHRITFIALRMEPGGTTRSKQEGKLSSQTRQRVSTHVPDTVVEQTSREVKPNQQWRACLTRLEAPSSVLSTRTSSPCLPLRSHGRMKATCHSLQLSYPSCSVTLTRNLATSASSPTRPFPSNACNFSSSTWISLLCLAGHGKCW